MRKQWEHFSREADLGIRGAGGSKEEAFEGAAARMIPLSSQVCDYWAGFFSLLRIRIVFPQKTSCRMKETLGTGIANSQ